MTRWPRAHVLAALGVALVLVAMATSSRTRPRPLLRAQYADAGGLRLRYVRGGHGPTVVLLHGYGESMIAWRGVFGALSGVADVIAFDLPGFGLSSKPPTGYATDSMAAVVQRALASLGVHHAAIVGHSMGGAVAAAVAVRDPAAITRLVLIDAAVVGTRGTIPDGASRDESVEATRRFIARYEAMRPRFTAPHDPDWLAEKPEDAAYLASVDTAYQVALTAVLREFDFDWLTPERATRLRMPTLVLWGEYDPLFPPAAGRALAAALPDARLVVIPRTWHRPHEERPDEVAAALVKFLGPEGPQTRLTP